MLGAGAPTRFRVAVYYCDFGPTPWGDGQRGDALRTQEAYLPGQHASTTILAPAAACRRTRILAGHSQRAGNATAATCTRRFLQVSVRPVLSVYPQSYLQFTCNSKSSKCNIKLYSMINAQLRAWFPRGTPFWGCGEFTTTFFERQLWPVLVT